MCILTFFKTFILMWFEIDCVFVKFLRLWNARSIRIWVKVGVMALITLIEYVMGLA